MVPGTAHGVAHDQAFCERAAVVGAVGADGKDLITAAGQNQFFAVGMARYHAAIAEIANQKSISEIGFVRLWCLRHDLPPEPISILRQIKDAGCHRTDGSVHTTRELREFLEHRGGLRLLRVPQPGPFAPRSSSATPASFSSRADAASQFSLAYAGRESVAR
jgi:hypothetical protein